VAFFIFKDYLPSVGDPFGVPKTNSKPAASPLFLCPSSSLKQAWLDNMHKKTT
jgi:hypothetical protein